MEQLRSYFSNNNVGMTKERYFEMCEMLGSEPIESEIPVEYDDLPVEVQESLRIYNNLQDSWDYMGGNYIGKNMSGFRDVLLMYDIPKEDHRTVYEFVIFIDSIRAKIIADSKPKK